jgi:hypothetical protein
VHDYRVATHGHAPRNAAAHTPEGRRHAFVKGAKTTACGFPLVAMRVFHGLQFSDETPSVRCPICARVVGADH